MRTARLGTVAATRVDDRGRVVPLASACGQVRRLVPSRSERAGLGLSWCSPNRPPSTTSAVRLHGLRGGGAQDSRRCSTAQAPRASSLLDVGCGTGRHLELLRERYEVEGLDVSPAMLSATSGTGEHLNYELPAGFCFSSKAAVGTCRRAQCCSHAQATVEQGVIASVLAARHRLTPRLRRERGTDGRDTELINAVVLARLDEAPDAVVVGVGRRAAGRGIRIRERFLDTSARSAARSTAFRGAGLPPPDMRPRTARAIPAGAWPRDQ